MCGAPSKLPKEMYVCAVLLVSYQGDVCMCSAHTKLPKCSDILSNKNIPIIAASISLLDRVKN